MRLQAEVIGRFDHPADANSLLYTPLAERLTARHTRRYIVDFEGDAESLAAFLTKVLADPVSHELRTGEAPALQDYAFFLDYGMKPGALDHEKEAIMAHHRSSSTARPGETEPAFTINNLRINHRVYLFGEADAEGHAQRFVRDIVNPAIHTWQITPAA